MPPPQKKGPGEIPLVVENPPPGKIRAARTPHWVIGPGPGRPDPRWYRGPLPPKAAGPEPDPWIQGQAR